MDDRVETCPHCKTEFMVPAGRKFGIERTMNAGVPVHAVAWAMNGRKPDVSRMLHECRFGQSVGRWDGKEWVKA